MCYKWKRKIRPKIEGKKTLFPSDLSVYDNVVYAFASAVTQLISAGFCTRLLIQLCSVSW